MAGETLEIVDLKDNFYRDGFYKALMALFVLIVAVILLIAVSIYLAITKPEPVYFTTDNDWRVLAPVPLDEPYLNTPDLLQWVSTVLPQAFSYDFVNYSSQMNANTPFFTDNGWKIFSKQLNIYANFNAVQTAKMFINAVPAGGPVILNSGLLSGTYGWWVRMPLNVSYNSAGAPTSMQLSVQALVVRISTLNNLNGVAIENIIVTKGNNNNSTSAHG